MKRIIEICNEARLSISIIEMIVNHGEKYLGKTLIDNEESRKFIKETIEISSAKTLIDELEGIISKLEEIVKTELDLIKNSEHE